MKEQALTQKKRATTNAMTHQIGSEIIAEILDGLEPRGQVEETHLVEPAFLPDRKARPAPFTWD